jgi:restriction system protein
MADITTRRQGEIVQALFRVLADHPEGLPSRDAIQAVSNKIELSPYELSGFASAPNEPRFPKLLRFATINAVKAGWLLKQKGHWTLTEEGRTALKDFPDPEDLFRRSRALYRAWKDAQPDTEPDVGPSDGEAPVTDEPSETDVVAVGNLEEAEDAARDDILAHLAVMNPYRFQDLVAHLVTAMGYHVVWTAPKGKDGGLDLLAQSDPLGVSGPRIKGQVKRRRDNKVTEEELRAFLSLLEPTDVGVYISLGGYTSDAQSLGRRTSRRVTLINGVELLDLWVDHHGRLDQEAHDLLPLKRVWFLDPAS